MYSGLATSTKNYVSDLRHTRPRRDPFFGTVLGNVLVLFLLPRPSNDRFLRRGRERLIFVSSRSPSTTSSSAPRFRRIHARPTSRVTCHAVGLDARHALRPLYAVTPARFPRLSLVPLQNATDTVSKQACIECHLWSDLLPRFQAPRHAPLLHLKSLRSVRQYPSCETRITPSPPSPRAPILHSPSQFYSSSDHGFPILRAPTLPLAIPLCSLARQRLLRLENQRPSSASEQPQLGRRQAQVPPDAYNSRRRRGLVARGQVPQRFANHLALARSSQGPHEMPGLEETPEGENTGGVSASLDPDDSPDPVTKPRLVASFVPGAGYRTEACIP